MRDVLSHRGPDAAGLLLWLDRKTVRDEKMTGTAGLSHRRLSIIDLSEAGAQPMASEDGDWCISYNGEFYSFQEYRNELIQEGHHFQSKCDTEVIVHLVAKYGIEPTLDRMNGMFALALYDRKAHRMILARDRLGKKPLYYHQRADGSLVFASEIKALLQTGWVDRSRIDMVAMSQFWAYGYIMGERTIYEEIRQIPPAHYGIWKDGIFTLSEYWDCPLGNGLDPSWNEQTAGDRLEELLSDAIRIRLLSDVPLGLFLSGGIDSSLVAALASRLAGPSSISSYTIAFRSSGYDESLHAQQVARHLGIANRILTVDEDMGGRFSEIARWLDQPFGDASCIPTWFLAQQARSYVTVALTGDGGDELFAGYPWYREALKLWGGYRIPSGPFHAKTFLWESKLRWLGPCKGMAALTRITSSRMLKRLFSSEMQRTLVMEDVESTRSKWLRRSAGCDLLTRMQYLDLHTYLPDDILVKTDRMSMAHSLECRNPFLDYRMVEFAFSLPTHLKVGPDGRGKMLLRSVLSRYLPGEFINRPKQGFTPPWQEWCQKSLSERLRKAWTTLPSGLFDPTSSGSLIPREGLGHPNLLWNAFSTCCFFEGIE
ncbi:MAG: asparagine synthase (glutamine-hydrolyzing) [Lentisphaerae bacterium GWF2_57_35]|nr:MAG: asparagine synthase (glutamine-hydrolyzing) [Lentisphaerae bacterium GWF2_57_35]